MELAAVDEDSIPIEVFVDNQSLEDALYSTKSVDDKQLRTDIGSIKQMLTTEKIAKIQWIPGDKMIANGLTKWGTHTYDLLRTVQDRHLAVIVLTIWQQL